MRAEQLAALIEHTLLKAEATGEQVDRLCDEAVQGRFHAVCVNPCWIRRCADRLGRTNVVVAGVVGFPLGAHRADTKVDEARRAIEDGAGELDMVIALGPLIAGQDGLVSDEMAAVAEVAHAADPAVLLKVILETAALSDAQIERACRLAIEAGADMLKTSTGFHPAGGARVEHVRLLKAHGRGCGVKAAGGIRTAADALAMVEAGATRIGTSAGPALIEGLSAQ
jgi:deoxyribose-phosphate aldolase